VLVSFKDRVNDEGVIFSRPRQVANLCRKLGCRHSRRYQVLHNAISKAARWFEQHEGSLDHAIRDGGIGFWMKRPVIPRPIKVSHPVSYDEPAAKPTYVKRKRTSPMRAYYPHMFRNANRYPDYPEIPRSHPDGTLVPGWED
jgi:hypothetical protein